MQFVFKDNIFIIVKFLQDELNSTDNVSIWSYVKKFTDTEE